MRALRFGAYAQKQQAKPWVQTYEASPATYDIVLPKNLPPKTAPQSWAIRKRHPLFRNAALSVWDFAWWKPVGSGLSNELGDKPLEIEGASIAIAGSDMDAVPGSIKRLTFGGNPGVVVPAGSPVL